MAFSTVCHRNTFCIFDNVTFYRAATTIQSVWRTFMARTHRIRQLYSVIIIQAVMRGCSGAFHQINDVVQIHKPFVPVNG